MLQLTSCTKYQEKRVVFLFIAYLWSLSKPWYQPHTNLALHFLHSFYRETAKRHVESLYFVISRKLVYTSNSSYIEYVHISKLGWPLKTFALDQTNKQRLAKTRYHISCRYCTFLYVIGHVHWPLLTLINVRKLVESQYCETLPKIQGFEWLQTRSYSYENKWKSKQLFSF